MKKLLLPIALSGLLSLPTTAFSQSGNWTSTAGGNWTDTANWTPAAVPGTAAGDSVNLNSNFTSGTKTINLNTNATVGSMVFGDGSSTSPSALILSGSSTLTFDNGASGATLTFQGSAASNTFNAPILLVGNLTISGASMFPNFGGTVAAASSGLKTISYNASAAYFQSTSVISDGAGQVAISQTGSGALTLNGTNTFSGGVKFTRATLYLGNSSALGTGDLTLTNVGTITLSAAEGLSFSNNMTLAGASIGGGAGNITWAGNLTQSAGSSINRVGRTDISGNVYLSANSTGGNTLVLGGTNNGNGSISGAISNWNGAGGTAGTINKIGNGTWTFSGANTYNGTTQVTGGTLIYGANQTIAANSQLNIKTVGTSTTATIDFAGFNATVNNILFGGTAATLGSANLLSTGNGTLTLGGSTAVSYSTASSTNPGTATISGKVDLGTGTRTFSVADSTQTTNELAITAAISSSAGTYGITKTGAGTMTLSGPNNYTGVTSVQDGILSVSSLNKVVGGSASSSLGAPVTSQNGTIHVGATTTTGQLAYTGASGETTDRVVNLAGTTGGAVLDQSGASGLLKLTSNFTATGAGNKTLTLQGSTAGTGEIAGAIVNNSVTNLTSVTKSGNGTWTLSGNNTYSGGTTVTSGTLLINGSTAAGSAFTVANGGTLGGNGTIGGAVTVQSGGTLAPGNSPGLLTVASLTLDSGSTSFFQINGTTRVTLYDAVNVTGALSYNGTLSITFGGGYTPLVTDTFTLFNKGSYSGAFSTVTITNPSYAGTFNESTGVLSLTSVPEPATWGLLAFSLTTVMVLRRRKR